MGMISLVCTTGTEWHLFKFEAGIMLMSLRTLMQGVIVLIFITIKGTCSPTPCDA